MLRALVFTLKVILLGAALLWCLAQPGDISFSAAGYDVTARTSFVYISGLAALVLLFFVFKIVAVILSLPDWIARKSAENKKRKGQRALTLGLTAVAAGDSKHASYQAWRTRKFLPDDKELSVLLEGQAARLKGDHDAARRSFQALMKNEDTAFLGLRGLMLESLEQNDLEQAATLAHNALIMHPRQPWVLRMAYDIEIRRARWDAALKILRRAEKFEALPAEKIRSDKTVILIMQAEELQKYGQSRQVLALLKNAHAANPGFVPAAQRLAQHYLDHGKKSAAAQIIEHTWKEAPHPALISLWQDTAPAKATTGAARLAWMEKLVTLRPDSTESLQAAATEAIEQNLYGIARQYLDRADAIRPGAHLYHLRAKLAQAQNRPEETSLMLKKAMVAPQDKTWICTQTGRVYDEWSPIAGPHGSFNTITWDYPHIAANDPALIDRSELLILAPARTHQA